MPVERNSGPVVTHCGSRVGVAGCFLDVSEWDAGVEGGSDERVAQRVRTDALVDPGSSGDTSNDSGGAVSVEPAAGAVAEDRPFARSPTAISTARAVRSASGIVTVLPPLRRMTRVR